MVVRKENSTVKIHFSEISSIIVETMQANISAYLMSELCKSKISLAICDTKHSPIGELLPLYGSHNTSKKVREQYAWGSVTKKRTWQKIIEHKITLQSNLLLMKGFESEAKSLASFASNNHSGDSTNMEACASRIYFKALFGNSFTRGSDCELNYMLNYGYAILLALTNREIVSRGYITQIGIFHRNSYNQYNLSCDFMEPFRPILDEEVLRLTDEGFNQNTRYKLANVANLKVAYMEGRYRLSSVLSQYINSCLKCLNKEISVNEIYGFESYESLYTD